MTYQQNCLYVIDAFFYLQLHNGFDTGYFIKILGVINSNANNYIKYVGFVKSGGFV